jgi:hypothetical protein
MYKNSFKLISKNLLQKIIIYMIIIIAILAFFAFLIDTIKILINNCYAYAFNDMSISTFKRQPGDIINKNTKNSNSLPNGLLGDLSKKDYTCEKMTKRILKDYPSTYTLSDTNNDTTCKKDYYKVMLAIDNIGNKQDYHFYKQVMDNQGNEFWQHKPGTTMIKNYDDSGNLILDINKADRNYDNKNDENDYNYATLCNSFCVKT